MNNKEDQSKIYLSWINKHRRYDTTDDALFFKDLRIFARYVADELEKSIKEKENLK